LYTGDRRRPACVSSSSGKRADQTKSAAYLSDFFGACPTATDRLSQFYLAKSDDSALMARVAAALRTRLGALWRRPPGAKPQESTEGRWEKPTKTLSSFELADLSGKTWKLATLEGKSVLINLWATWCGPCQVELPHLQKLYETVKDRPGLQILTLNLDEDLGLVETFMKEKGYTFPVLPAFSYVTKLLDGFAIPQIWIVDPKGNWRWTQLGFGGEPDWLGVMIAKMESVKKTD